MEQLSKRRPRTVQKSMARKGNSCTSLGWRGGLADSKPSALYESVRRYRKGQGLTRSPHKLSAHSTPPSHSGVCQKCLRSRVLDLVLCIPVGKQRYTCYVAGATLNVRPTAMESEIFLSSHVSLFLHGISSKDH